MKFNVSCPATGSQKLFEIDDERKLRCVYDKRVGAEVEGQDLDENWAGYVFRISGGNDKQGFPMQNGVLVASRVRLLMKAGSTYYRPRRVGERRRKSVRGCIVGPDISILNLNIVKQGEKVIEGLTDSESARPRRLGPKRANNIRKTFNLTKEVRGMLGCGAR